MTYDFEFPDIYPSEEEAEALKRHLAFKYQVSLAVEDGLDEFRNPPAPGARRRFRRIGPYASMSNISGQIKLIRRRYAPQVTGQFIMKGWRHSDGEQAWLLVRYEPPVNSQDVVEGGATDEQ